MMPFVPLFSCGDYTTGYWLMDAFQRYKKRGQLRKGHDFEICYRLTAKDYASYAPIICVATFIGFLHAHITIHSSIGDMITSFCWNLMSFLGLQGLAYHGTSGKFIMYTLSDGGSFAPTDIVAFQDTMWYLSAIVAFCCFFFVLLVISEKFTMFFAVPMVFILGNLTIDGGVTGFNAILPGSFSRLWTGI